jgi:Ca2+-binding RTX toxin-like protein
VERIQWNETSDMIVLGKGVGLVEDGVTLEPVLQHRSDGSDHPGLQHIASGRLIELGNGAQIVWATAGSALSDSARHLELNGAAVNGQKIELRNRIVANSSDKELVGLARDDTLYGDSGNDTLMGGHGSNSYVYLLGDGSDVIIDEGPGVDTDVLILTGGITRE